MKIDKNACQECLSFHAFCGFKETFPLGVKCGPLYQPDCKFLIHHLFHIHCIELTISLACQSLFFFLFSRKNKSFVPTKSYQCCFYQNLYLSADDLRELCSQPFSCGNQRNLLYPFWIPSREECGHPDFMLECSGSFAELSISSVKFRILEVNYTSRITRLAPDTDMLKIYYECPNISHSVTTYVGNIPCDDDHKSYYVTRNLSSPLLRGVSGLLNDFKVFCRRNVSIPASRSALNTLERTPTLDNLKKALEEGFKLELNKDCSMCIDSGGSCGYNQVSRRFVCYCEGWTDNHICDRLFWGKFFFFHVSLETSIKFLIPTYTKSLDFKVFFCCLYKVLSYFLM